MNALNLWNAFTAQHPEVHTADYDAWSFGDAPDELATLVLSGRKRATSSALPLYALEGEALPAPGEYSVLLNSRGEALCVLCTTAVRVLPFCDVPAEFASLEGEGDLSLTHWRQVHESFFTRAMGNAGLIFTPCMPVVCEEFEVVFP